MSDDGHTSGSDIGASDSNGWTRIRDVAKAQAIEWADQGSVIPALILLEAYLSIKPDDGYAWFVYGDVLKEVYRFSEARAAYSRALALAPNGKEYLAELRLAALENACGRFEDSEGWYSRAFERAEIDAEAIRWPYMLRGTNLLALGRASYAERLFQVATTLENQVDDDLNEAWHMYSVALALQGKYSEASTALETGLESCPGDVKSETLLRALKLVPHARSLAAKALAQR